MDQKLILNFDNGWRASVVYNGLSYGLELATLKYDPDTEDYDFKQFPGVTGEDGINGYLTSHNLVELLNTISNG